MKAVTAVTAASLGAIGGLHAAWGAGATIPFDDAETLARTVAGTSAMPGRRESFAVASLLAIAAALVADVLPLRHSLRAAGVVGVAAVLGARGGLGLAGRTEALVPWVPDRRFVEHDRRVFGPLCVAHSLGSLASLGDRRRPR